MNKEIKTILTRIANVNEGEPWFGRSVYSLLAEVDSKKAMLKPAGDGHAMIELLYHMITWAGFTLARIEKDHKMDLVAFEKLDWRKIVAGKHSWRKALAAFKSIQKKIVQILGKKDDGFLDEKVEFRNYNFRYLVNGMIDHNIYHLGQIALLHKLALN